jgi:hypothetical protein
MHLVGYLYEDYHDAGHLNIKNGKIICEKFGQVWVFPFPPPPPRYNFKRMHNCYAVKRKTLKTKVNEAVK